MADRTYLLIVLVAASACSDPEPPSRAFSDWSRTADTARIAAERLVACTPPGHLVGHYESAELSRVVGGRILPDGRVAVADGLQRSILVFSDKAPPERIGRSGEGPGEFESLRGLFLLADTLLAWDRPARRITALSASGEIFWTRSLSSDGSFSGVTRSGHYPILVSVSPSVEVEGAFRDTAVVLLARPDRPAVFSVRFPSSYQYSAREGRGWRSHEQIFSPRIHLTTVGGTAWIGESATGELAGLGPRGEPARLLQLELAPRQATRAMIEAERRMMSSVGAGTSVENIADRVPAFETLPIFEALRGSSDGQLIIAEYVTESDDHFRTWLVDPLSPGVICLNMASGSRVLDSRGGVVLVETRDELDVPALQLRLIEPDA